MAELITPDDIENELALTADYDFVYSVDKAQRRAAALRRKLDMPQSSGQGDRNHAFAMQAIENQLNQVLSWLRDNSPLTEQQRLCNPSVVHADFCTFHGYQR